MICRQVPVLTIAAGTVDQQTGVHTPGIEIILANLSRRFGQSDAETAIMHVIDLLTFHRVHSESIDDALSRFETLRHMAGDEMPHNFSLPFQVQAWLLLTGLGIPRSSWPLLRARYCILFLLLLGAVFRC